jgi:hypothetical protein
MESASPSAKRNSGFYYFLAVIAARVVGMPLVAVALPVAHTMFGEDFQGGQQQALGSMLMFCDIGFVAAFAYLVAATLAHFIVLKKSLRTRLWVEVGVFAVFIITLVYGGVTAHQS